MSPTQQSVDTGGIRTQPDSKAAQFALLQAGREHIGNICRRHSRYRAIQFEMDDAAVFLYRRDGKYPLEFNAEQMPGILG
jgi:hypothetical protein